MSDQNDDYGDWRRWRDRGQSFLDRVKDWFRGDREDYRSEEDWHEHPRYYRPGYNRDNARIYQADRGGAYDRTRQWRRDRSNYEQAGYDRDPFGYRYGVNYGADYGYGGREPGGDDMEWDRNNQGNRWNRQRPGYPYRQTRAGESFRPEDAYESNDDRRRDYERYRQRPSRHMNRYGQRNAPRQYERPPRGYPTAGMRSDFGADYDYDDHEIYNEDLNYRRGDVGYDSEGAFYQDLDEPMNYQSWMDWRAPGRFTGIGPQGYRRSDERISDEVCDLLTQHGQIDASDIEIQVNDGDVTLKGNVPDRHMKRLAEDLAENITGVRNVNNQIKVQQRRGSGWSDWRYEHNRQEENADFSPAGQTNIGAGLTTEGATSLYGLEEGTGIEEKRSQLREGMEVVGADGKIVGRVKEIRQQDILVDREMQRDVYVPYSALRSVRAQARLTINADEVDLQNWNKPQIIG